MPGFPRPLRLSNFAPAFQVLIPHPLRGPPGAYRLSFVAQFRHGDGRTIDAARRDVPIHLSDADPAEQRGGQPPADLRGQRLRFLHQLLHPFFFSANRVIYIQYRLQFFYQAVF